MINSSSLNDSNMSIIKYPIITDKATRLLAKNQYSFVANPKSDKPTIKAAIEYLFNVSLGLIDYYEKLFDVAFPLPKLDHVTVPDFNFGAMENFGLIIYK